MSEPTGVSPPVHHGDAALPEDENPAEGGGFAESAFDLWRDLHADDWGFAVGVDLAATALDGLDAVLDPLGALLDAGVGWLLEHLAILTEPLEVLTGIPDEIEALSQMWARIAGELDDVANDYAASMATVSHWGGRAANGYRRTAAAYQETLRGAADHARHAAQGIAVAGAAVATERGVVFDMVSSFVGGVIERAVIAAASSVITMGGSVAAFLARLSADVAAFAARIQARLARLLQVLEDLVRRFALAGNDSRTVANALMHESNRLRRQAGHAIHNAEKTARSLRPAEGSTLARYVARTERMSETRLGRLNDHPAVEPVIEGAKGLQEFEDELLVAEPDDDGTGG